MEASEGLELSVGDKKVRMWGDSVVQVLQLCALCVVAFGLYRHDVEGAERDKSAVQAIKEQTQVQREQLNAQREANCLNRLNDDQKKQQKEIEFCRQLGQGR